MAGEHSQTQLQAHVDGINSRLAGIEQQLKRLSDSTGSPYSTFAEEREAPDEVAKLAASGDKPGAVGRLRELTGVEFEQAHDAVAGP
jgi:hypothetical protein